MIYDKFCYFILTLFKRWYFSSIYTIQVIILFKYWHMKTINTWDIMILLILRILWYQVLDDRLFERQTKESFVKTALSKAVASLHLDRLSRSMCPKLDHFVLFSSVTCGFGNTGQTNYGMANSVMERICEQRHADKLPALAIEWGPMGDVGVLTKDGDAYKKFSAGMNKMITYSSLIKNSSKPLFLFS